MSTKAYRSFFEALAQLPPKTRNSLKVLLLAVFCVVAFVFHIWFRTKVLTSGYSVGQLRQEISRLESQLASFSVDKNRLMSPDELERLVRLYNERGIGLRAPEKSQTIYLSREGLDP